MLEFRTIVRLRFIFYKIFPYVCIYSRYLAIDSRSRFADTKDARYLGADAREAQSDRSSRRWCRIERPSRQPRQRFGFCGRGEETKQYYRRLRSVGYISSGYTHDIKFIAREICTYFVQFLTSLSIYYIYILHEA